MNIHEQYDSVNLHTFTHLPTHNNTTNRTSIQENKTKEFVTVSEKIYKKTKKKATRGKINTSRD